MNEEFVELAHFRYPTHNTYVSQCCDSGRIHCLKYSKRGIIWEYFEYCDWHICKEYMIHDLPDHSYGFVEDED